MILQNLLAVFYILFTASVWTGKTASIQYYLLFVNKEHLIRNR